MKIRSVELTNFRKFVGTVRVDTIGDNVNVLVGRNELGKSTLLQAINGVIFEKARSTASHVKEVVERLSEISTKVEELESKAKSVSELLTDLARNRHDLKDAHTGWDETAHRAELEGERNERVTAATFAAEIARARRRQACR